MKIKPPVHSDHKQSPLSNVPNGWEVVKVEDIFEVYGGTTPSTSNREYWDGDTLWVTPTDVTNLDGKLNLNETKKKITEKAVKDSSLKILQPGTLLLTSRATIGFAAINLRPVTINQGMAALIKRSGKNTDSTFYAYYFGLLKDYLERLGAGSTFKEVSKYTIKKLKISLPPLPEQRRIAEILSTVDQAIQRVDEAITRTERLKRGLMQRLLTRGIGHSEFRFSKELGCEIPKGWEVLPLAVIGEIITGTTPSTKIQEYWGEDYPFVTPTDFSDSKYVRKTERKVSSKGASKGRVIPKNSVMVVCIASIGEVALAAEECITNQQINSIICNEHVDPHYVYYTMLHMKHVLIRWAGSTTSPIIKKSLFEKFLILLPPLHEQRKIAEILSTADKKLELERERKEKLGQIKRGLMNDLLTGKKRIRVEA